MGDMENEMLQRITRVEEKVNNVNEKLDRAINANETAVRALASADSAHHRLNKIEDYQKWMWRTFAAVIIVAVATFVVNGGLK